MKTVYFHLTNLTKYKTSLKVCVFILIDKATLTLNHKILSAVKSW